MESKLDLDDAKFIAKRKLQVLLDRLNPHKAQRWAAFALVLSVFLIRVYI